MSLIDKKYLLNTLKTLLEIPSPTGYTDAVVHWVGQELNTLGIPYEVTRRGAIRADLAGQNDSHNRAMVGHLDTIGTMVKSLKPNGRLEIVPIGTWSSRAAEGARVTVFTETGSRSGTILPLKASGHIYNEEVDSQPCNWENVEIRIDERVSDANEISDLGIQIGDYVSIRPGVEFLENGYIISRHIDGKAGAAILLAVGKALVDKQVSLPIASHLLFTISEEVGSGASAVLHKDVAEMVTLDMAAAAPEKDTNEHELTVVMKDSSGPFDYHLTHKLIGLCRDNSIPFVRDIMRHYFCDSASAIEAGNDIRTALISYGVDASHGYERTHIDSVVAVADLVLAYLQSPPAVARDKDELSSSVEDFPTQPE